MLEFCALASCMPFHADSLNDRSSTPPTSSTMQALRPEPDAPPDVVEPAELEGLDPQAASATHVAAVSARTRTVPFTIPPQCLLDTQPAGPGERGKYLTDFADSAGPPAACGKARGPFNLARAR